MHEVEPGGPGGVGRVIDLHTRGWLPYTLRWSFRVTESREPYGFTLEAWGDFVGEGVWTFAEDGDFVDITYDWRISAEKPLLRRFSGPLRLELERRRAAGKASASGAPPPGAPSRTTFAVAAGVVTAALLGFALLRSR